MTAVRPAEITERKASPSFANVFASLAPQMAALDSFLHSQLGAFEPEIRSMIEYCLDTSGKRIRPALVFLSGWRGPHLVSPELVRAAAVVEMVHLATLVHDDIMDGAEVRRNRRTASREYGPTAAVLLGDALFAHALHLATEYPTTDVCSAVSESTRKVCSGEIVQTLRRGSTNVTIADYRRVIDLKTAELFRVSCLLGAQLSRSAPSFASAAASYGRHLGIAYQIYDDLADYFGEERKVGKTLGTDLASGKLTLPSIILAERLPNSDREELMEELTGNRPPQLELRVRQMGELGVFELVSNQIQQELTAAESALIEVADEPPAPMLKQLSDVLRGQVLALRSASPN